MQIKRKMMSQLETFLSEYPSYEEQGGYLLQNRRGAISEFILIPNMSSEPKNSYKTTQNAKSLADKFASSRHLRVEAFFHSHPEPCIMSAADAGYASQSNLVFVTITPTDKWVGRKKQYIWYACSGIKPIRIEEV